MSVSQLLASLPTPAAIQSLPYKARHAEMATATAALGAASDDLLARAKAGNRDLLASEQRDFDRLNDCLRDLELADRAARTAETEAARVNSPTAPDAYRRGAPLTRSQTFSGYLRARGLAGGSGYGEHLDFDRIARGLALGDWTGADAERRVMAESPTSAGGFLVPSTVVGQLVDLARPKSACLAAGARLLPMETPTVTIPKWLSDPTAAWRDENEEIIASTPTVGPVELTARSLAALVIVSRELLEDSVVPLGGQLAAAFAARFAQEIDRVALRGSGVAPEPAGILHSGATVAAVPGAPMTPIWPQLRGAMLALESADETPNAAVAHPRTWAQLDNQWTDHGTLIEPPASVAALPKFSTTQIPTDLTVGTSTSCTELYVGDFTQLVIGVRTQLLIQPLVERYSSFGQVGFVCHWRGDIAVTRAAAFHVSTGLSDLPLNA